MDTKIQKKTSWTSSPGQVECWEVAPSHTQTCALFGSAPGITKCNCIPSLQHFYNELVDLSHYVN